MEANERGNPLVGLSNALAEAVSKASAATVMVDARRRLPASGIVFSPNLILTANHVVERDDEIRITLPNQDQTTGTIAGRDHGSDLALIKLTKGELLPAEITEDEASIGQLVLALGRPSPNGIQASLGVVSAIGGPVHTRRGSLLEQYIRTDAIPYPGFSGGPLVSASGQIIAINTSGLSHGASLAIPASLAWQTANALAQHGHVRRGYLGIRSQVVPIQDELQEKLGRRQDTGLLLVGIEKNSPASASGLIIGDILVGINKTTIADPDQLLNILMGDIVEKPASLEILRGGQPQIITVKVGVSK